MTRIPPNLKMTKIPQNPKNILVIFWVLGGILIILRFEVFWSFLKILEYFSHFYFSGILVIRSEERRVGKECVP